MECDRGESFLFNYELKSIPFGTKLKGKLPPRSYPIQFERKWKYSFLGLGVGFCLVLAKFFTATCMVWRLKLLVVCLTSRNLCYTCIIDTPLHRSLLYIIHLALPKY